MVLHKKRGLGSGLECIDVDILEDAWQIRRFKEPSGLPSPTKIGSLSWEAMIYYTVI